MVGHSSINQMRRNVGGRLQQRRDIDVPHARCVEPTRQKHAFKNPVHWHQVPVDAATAIQADAAVLVTYHPALAQTGQHPVLSALRL